MHEEMKYETGFMVAPGIYAEWYENEIWPISGVRKYVSKTICADIKWKWFEQKKKSMSFVYFWFAQNLHGSLVSLLTL